MNTSRTRRLSALTAGLIMALVGVIGAAAPAQAAQPGDCRPGVNVQYSTSNVYCAAHLQTYLNGYQNARLAVDGYFGNLTKTAVTIYQKNARVGADGIVGPITKEAIHARMGIPVNSGATRIQIVAAGQSVIYMLRGWGIPLN